MGDIKIENLEYVTVIIYNTVSRVVVSQIKDCIIIIQQKVRNFVIADKCKSSYFKMNTNFSMITNCDDCIFEGKIKQ